ncbi:phosphoglycerate mutase [Neofusicoccum parvum]|uniref:Phosphoglycerate mutase n=1 Tax=Neofusicoccum parvum TaxID=310453 RepID=A0ACB5SIQ1_9PEZI|nr:phosphoglycerate mutase [Neofusicoccum parvum]
MHLDSVVARHYHLQKAASRAARAAPDDFQTSEHRVITVKPPPCYPPLEDVVDLRIPMHFVDFDLRNNFQQLSYLDVPQEFHDGVGCLLRTLVTPLDADIHLCSMESFTPDGEMLNKADGQRSQGARHGARLDAADKTWHLTSPTPYDPPLTYGGWTQSRALGTRIASLLQAREEADGLSPASHSRSNSLDAGLDQHASASPDGRRRRKHKVVVHSSPYLRCVQTAVAISAGIAQYQASPPASRSRSISPRRRASLHSTTLNGRGSERSPGPKAIPEPEDDPTRNVLSKAFKKKGIEKTTLRVDAFLGEWLSPDYFDLITPPPNSTMMVASAKADLLRRGEYIDARPNSSQGSGNFPGGWGSDRATGAANTFNSAGASLSGLGSLAQALPLRDRASSQGSASSAASRASRKRDIAIPTTTRSDTGIYRAPVPAYAVSPAEPIPRGYVAHARDACVDVDYQWDSMREPQEWGDGGEYGEEWSAMHKRFRRGLTNMISWYKEHGPGGHPDEAIVDSAEDEEDEDLVLVLVTHGAGCNALIGALTNQPVLLDVGMASLTMAVKKEIPNNKVIEPASRTPSPMNERRRSGLDRGLSDDYEMVLVASTEHLRVGADPAKPGLLAEGAFVDQMSDLRRRYGAQAASGGPIDNVGETARRTSSSLGSMRRSSTIHTLTRSYTPSPGRHTPSSPSLGPSTGLWSKPAPKEEAPSPTTTNGPNADFLLNFATENGSASEQEKDKENEKEQEQEKEMEMEQDTPEKEEAEDNIAPLPPNIGRSMSQHGLWGSHSIPDLDTMRSFVTAPLLVGVWLLAALGAAEHTSNWAVLVSTSRFWFNYRHLANVLSVYRTVKRLGIPDSQIILMLPDDMACNPRNAFPGTVYNNADRALDLYGDNIEVDYRGYEVTVENFIRLMTDRVGEDMPRSKRLLTDDRSNILVYMTGHGGNEFLKFQDAEEISAFDLADAFEQMWEKKRYHEMLFMIDTCQANTMYSKFYSPNIIATGSSEIDQSSYSHHADNDVGVAVIDRYTYYNLEFLETQVKDPSSKLTLGDLFDSYDEAKIHSHPGVRYDLFQGGEQAARERLVMDFFGNVQNVEVEGVGRNESKLQEELEYLSRLIEAAKQKHNESEPVAAYGAGVNKEEASVEPDNAKRFEGAAKIQRDDGWGKQLIGLSAVIGMAGVWAAGSWLES